MMRSIRNTFRNAFHGLGFFIKNEPNNQIHFIIASIALAGGFWLGISNLEWIAVILCIGLVLAAEALNTALEKLGDAIAPEKHDERIKMAKDISAAAVLIASLTALIVGGVIFIPRLIALLG